MVKTMGKPDMKDARESLLRELEAAGSDELAVLKANYRYRGREIMAFKKMELMHAGHSEEFSAHCSHCLQCYGMLHKELDGLQGFCPEGKAIKKRNEFS